MLLNHLIMPIIVRCKPRNWFPHLLINLKRLGIFIVVFLGYAYYLMIGETYMLVNMGLISFAAAAQFAPALIGALYWRRGNKAGAIAGIVGGFLVWFYTLLLPSFIKSGWWQTRLLEQGPFGLTALRPTELFGLSGLDIMSNTLFWSMFFNIGGYLIFSIVMGQSDTEKEQVRKFVDVFKPLKPETGWETKRLSKPVTIMEFVNLMAKFIGENQAHMAISEYLGDREIDEQGRVSEFELPNLKRFIEKTLAGSVGAAAAGAIVESYLSDIGSQMESFYDVFRSVRSSLEESREALYVRLRSSEIMNRSQDLQSLMDELLELLQTEFKFELVVVRLFNTAGLLVVRSVRGGTTASIYTADLYPADDHFINELISSRRPQFSNDTRNLHRRGPSGATPLDTFAAFAHIPIISEGGPTGVLSVFSVAIVGLFTEPLLNLLSSLAGQLAQAVELVEEREAKDRERREKEIALTENARVARDMELAKQIQRSLLPAEPPRLPGLEFATLCVPAAHVGGDYYDFFIKEDRFVDTVIADVSGHNVGSALIMVEARTVLRTQVNTTSSTAEILYRLNELLLHDLGRAELFITMFYVKYDRVSRLLTYSSAGHNKPLLHRKGSSSCLELDAEGLILGIREGVLFEEKSMQLSSGDTLLLYTDGLTESANQAGELFGTERLEALLVTLNDEPIQTVIDTIFREMTLFAGGSALADDVSMVIMRVS
jgi:sigma-B regulation protein RsbU (phosphoserine phosphatase)